MKKLNCFAYIFLFLAIHANSQFSLVKDINPGSGFGAPYFLTDVNGTLFFTANNGTNGLELWKSNGTAAGTVMVKDLNWSMISAYTPVNQFLWTIYFYFKIFSR